MADNMSVTPGNGATIAADDVGGVLYQRIKVAIGADGAAADLTFGQQTKTASLPVVLASNQDTLPVNQTSSAKDVALTITRPADMNAYAANDVVGGPLTFAAVRSAAGALLVTGTQLELDIASVPAGMTSFRLYLYSATPGSAVADNGAFVFDATDRPSFLGYVDLGTPVLIGSTLYVEVNNIGKQIRTTGTDLFAYLVTAGAYTPAANSEVYKVTLHTIEV
ncbi:hypothetical protein EVB32_316 [Rhizobium phage RHph_TM39]|uniref:Uncharacterized protein n=2 Tax=Cuauhnahuacvirus TaxID=3044696 RepID=A0A7S5RHD0_9CAUD|nr:hypothetical protein PQC16_gp324 [Rhizobium phage RHph_TM30]YP_010671465.1 hypothetical protein PQC17_gp325 [Rhizobium phage RHph_Y65]QIG71788.1 hypothetical protein EVB94_337 [Rhizobium phage RHph_TM40]QIG72149.1 hypothetical protein EVB95_335 [Rhizobium phage RHph_TM2_3B]QIG72511.1 hypothetical protein EVB96_335 [Rhizobium phage RHph_TM3_3_6]QIG77284.1 hypothetical protein EVB32_316 [Rhizobium phage RHph_TM39]QIG77571.1 hypothetical protein EVB61_265 [Rhizobium phage RHph_TM21B]QIG77901